MGWGVRGMDGKGGEGEGEGEGDKHIPHNGYNHYTAYIELIERDVPVKSFQDQFLKRWCP